MAHVPTATKVLDGFLAARAASVAPPTVDRDREVVGWLFDCVQARGVEPIDDLTAYLLSHTAVRTKEEGPWTGSSRSSSCP